jgi:GNAT superfamily N-acetyltransferase
MIELQPLSDFSFAEASSLWNEGFTGYAVDISLSLDDFVARLHKSGVSIEKSLVAKFEGRPVGFLMNAFRKHAGNLNAWNAGTGVIPEFRARGIGRVLVEGALQIYKEESVEVATLEAISTNAAAIALYKSTGYERVGELTFLQHDGALDFAIPSANYVFEEVAPVQVSSLSFYDALVPWQTHWQHLTVNGGQGLVIYDDKRVPVGYALFRRQFENNGLLQTITLHQCVADPKRPDAPVIVESALSHIFSPLSVECSRSTYNFNKSNQIVVDLLQRAGFTTYIEQVMMWKYFK